MAACYDETDSAGDAVDVDEYVPATSLNNLKLHSETASELSVCVEPYLNTDQNTGTTITNMNSFNANGDELTTSRNGISNSYRETTAAAETSIDLNTNAYIVYPAGSVQSDCIELAEDVVGKMTNRKLSARCKLNRHAPTMIRTVDELSEKHDIVFNAMMNKLDVTSINASLIFTKVVDEIFNDGLFNWGRVATVYAFAGWLARHCCHRGMPDNVDAVTKTAGRYVAGRLSSWIETNGGWDAFDEFFKERDSAEKKIWRGLMYTIFGLGVGAVATVIAAR